MAFTIIRALCSRCRGSGIDDNGEDPISCIPCNGVGYVEASVIDTTEIMEQLGAILGKVNAIWNQVKPGV